MSEQVTHQRVYQEALSQYDRKCFTEDGTPCTVIKWCAANIMNDALDATFADPDTPLDLSKVREAARKDASLQVKACSGISPDGKCQL